jgi:hypothetical protein
MLYRMTPPRAPRLLLRSVAVVGIAAGATACGGDATHPVGPCGGDVCGVVAMPLPDAGTDASTGPCGGHVCGVLVMPEDGGEDASASSCCPGLVAMPEDAGTDR